MIYFFDDYENFSAEKFLDFLPQERREKFEKLKIKKDMVTIYRKKDNTLKITLPNRISLIMFHAEDELCDKLQNHNPGYYTMNIVARCAANEYNGNVSPQLKIKDFEIVGQGMYDF